MAVDSNPEFRYQEKGEAQKHTAPLVIVSSELDTHIETMRAAGIDDDQMVSLAQLKRRISLGACNELTPEYKQLLFGRYLREHEIINEYRIIKAK